MGGACGATPRLAAAGCAKACRPRRWRFVACTSLRTVHRHAARPCLWSFHATPHARGRLLRQGRSRLVVGGRSEEHTSELQSLMRISYAVFCLKKKKKKKVN